MGETDYSGLPEDLIRLTKIFYPSETIIVSNDAEVSTTWQTLYELMKEITLRTSIWPTSDFRFKFKMKKTGGSVAYGQIYRNGLPIGTAQTTSSDVYVEFVEDITTVIDWTNNDKIQLMAKAPGPGSAQVSDFRLCGISSEFENTKVT